MRLMRPISELRDQMDQLFHEMEEFQFPGFSTDWRGKPARSWLPAADLSESNGNYELTVEVPGIKAEDLNIEVQDDAVIIQGESREETEEEHKDFYRKECHKGSIYRKIPLPGPVKTEDITAELNNGLLEVTLPKAEEKKGRKISVKAK